MAISEDLRKTLTDPTPLYAVVGTADFTAEKLREVPALIGKVRTEAPDRIASLRENADPQKVGERAKEAQAKFNETLSNIDVKHLRDAAQDFALRQVGRAAEAAVQARETYDEMAERGRGVVNHLRGEAAEGVEDVAVAIEPEPAPKPAPKAAPKAAPKTAAGTAADGDGEAKPAAKRTTRATTGRKSAPAKPAE